MIPLAPLSAASPLSHNRHCQDNNAFLILNPFIVTNLFAPRWYFRWSFTYFHVRKPELPSCAQCNGRAITPKRLFMLTAFQKDSTDYNTGRCQVDFRCNSIWWIMQKSLSLHPVIFIKISYLWPVSQAIPSFSKPLIAAPPKYQVRSFSASTNSPSTSIRHLKSPAYVFCVCLPPGCISNHKITAVAPRYPSADNPKFGSALSSSPQPAGSPAPGSPPKTVKPWIWDGSGNWEISLCRFPL